MAFGLVIVTTLAVAAIAHAIIPGMSWGVAFVLGAIVSSTDEVAFASIADQLNVPRHIIGTIEGESLVNDATSLILYGIGIAAVVGASFSLLHAAGALVLTVVESVLIGFAVAGIAVWAWRALKEDTLQATISVVVPFLAYFPAYYHRCVRRVGDGHDGSRHQPIHAVVLQPRAREMLTGFWVTVVFLLNAFIFTEVGIRFHRSSRRCGSTRSRELLWWGMAVAAACVIVRLIWTFAQGLLPITNEPEHVARQSRLVARRAARLDGNARRRLARGRARDPVRNGCRAVSVSRSADILDVRRAARHVGRRKAARSHG